MSVRENPARPAPPPPPTPKAARDGQPRAWGPAPAPSSPYDAWAVRRNLDRYVRPVSVILDPYTARERTYWVLTVQVRMGLWQRLRFLFSGQLTQRWELGAGWLQQSGGWKL